MRYSSGSRCSDSRLTDYEKFTCKMAQSLDIEKGGNSATALIVLKGLRGPEYVFAQNSRKPSELERAKAFLSNLIEYVGVNPDRLATRPLQKQVFSRILQFNFPRFEVYLDGFATALEACIHICGRSQEAGSKYM